MNRAWLNSLSIRRLLQVWAGLTLAAMLVLSVVSLLSNQFIVNQQQRLSQQAQPIEAASRELLQAVSELVIRQERVFTATTRDEFKGIPSRADIERRAHAAIEHLGVLARNSRALAIALGELNKKVREIIRIDTLVSQQTETYIGLKEQIWDRTLRIEAIVSNLLATMETVTGRISLAQARDRRSLRTLMQSDDASPGSLLKEHGGALSGDSFAVQRASAELQFGVAELKFLGHELTDALNPDRINDLRDNEIRPRLSSVANALVTVERSVGAKPALQRQVRELHEQIEVLTDVLINGDYSAESLRIRSLNLAEQLRVSQLNAAAAFEGVKEDMAKLSRITGDVTAEALERSRDATLIGRAVVAGIGASGTLVIVGLVSLLMRRISNPLANLRSAMHDISGGDLSRRLDEGGVTRDEFSDLAVDFNLAASTTQTLVAELALAKESLQSVAAQTRAILNGVPDGIITFDASGRVLTANPAAERIFEVTSGQLDQCLLSTLISSGDMLTGAPDVPFGVALKAYYEGGRRAEGRRVDGSVFPVWVSADNVGGEANQLFIAVVSNMTAFIEAEKARLKNESLFRTIYENVPVMIAGFDAEGRCVLWNRELENALGWTREQATADRRILSKIYPDAEDRKAVHEVMRNHDGVFREFRPTARDGTRQTHLWANFVLPDGLAISTGYDITARKGIEEQLKSTTLELETILQNALVGIAHVRGARVTRVNRKLEELFGFGPGVLEGRDLSSLFTVADVRHRLLERSEACIRQGNVYEDELAVMRRDGSHFWCALSINAISATNPERGAIWLFEDVTARRDTEEKLRYLASYDTLTKLPNRALFNDRLRQALRSAERMHHSLAVLYVDLDHFKHVNDSLGHSVGDLLLYEVAERLTQCVRNSDTVARLGGDEFTVILDAIEPTVDASMVAQKIIDTLSKPYVLEGQEVTISPSVGIGIFPNDGQDIEMLLRNADAAMYHAKESGRSAYRFYSPEMNANSSARLRLGVSLRRALDNNEFVLEYQPQIDIATRRITAVEALLRWENPEMGRVMPTDFIPILEETGLIVPVGDWVLRHAVRECADLLAAGICIAVNISGRQFRDEQLSERVAGMLIETGIRPELLELEITETVVMGDTGVALKNLERLNALGIRISIDDFGMGYSSLAYLKRFPIDSLKIDRSFIREIPLDSEDTAIVEAIIAMSRRLNLQVVAEGVETEEQFDFLRRNLCQRAQGWLFSKAVPAATLLQMIATKPKAQSRAIG